MKTLENSLLQLAEEIYAGKSSYSNTVAKISALETQYGAIVRDIEYPEYPEQVSKNYMDELIGRVRVGLYSKPLIMDLAKAADEVYGVKGNSSKIKKPVIIGVAVAAIAILVVIVAISMGE